MLALRVVEHLDVIEHVLPGFFAGPIGSPSDPFPLGEVEEAFGHRVVVAVSSAAHGVLKIVGAQEGGPIHAGELAALDALMCVKTLPRILCRSPFAGHG